MIFRKLLRALLPGLLAVTTIHTASGQSIFGNALSFNGTNQAVIVSNFGNIIPTSEITVEFWAYATKSAGHSAFTMNVEQSGNRFNAHINYGTPPQVGITYWDFGNIDAAVPGRLGGGTIPAPANSISNWTHYALVASQSGNYMSIYTNGVLQATKSGMTPFTRFNYPLYIAGASGFSFNGRLDDFRIWSVARSAAEIQANYSVPLVGNEPSLLVYYKFDSSSGTVATNSATATGAAYNGVLSNNPTWIGSMGPQQSLATLAATGVSNTVAQLNGTVGTNSVTTTAWFEWGLYGANNTNTTTPINLGINTASLSVNSVISNLTPGLVYYARIVASNTLGVARGRVVTFGSPTVTLTGGGATVTNECHAPFTPGAAAAITPIAIASGYMHNLAAKSDGTVIGWGGNVYGQTNIPADLSNVVSVAVGDYHSVALKSDGTVAAWGAGTTNTASTPHFGQSIIPGGLSNVLAIAAGGVHTIALKSDGRLVAWGENVSGQTNIPSTLSNVVAISAGYYHNLALKSDGTAVAWGFNGTVNITNVPAGLNSVVAISAGKDFNLALRSNGTITAWGRNTVGQTNVPAGLTNVVAISGGDAHCLALKRDGTVVAWGDGGDGRTNVPTGLTNVVAIAAGRYHSVAMKTDGTIVGWGRNFEGQTNTPGSTISSALVGSNFNTNNAPGSYTATYGSTNILGGIATVSRTVVVQDTVRPVITMLGNNPMTNLVNTVFVDPGATALDACAGTVAIVTNSTVNTNVAGSYTVTYTATDSSGNSTNLVRTVVVQPPPPVVTTLAAANITATGANLIGTVNPNGVATVAYFQFGTSTSYGSFSQTNSLGAVSNVVSITNLVGLSPATTYHYRIVASNMTGVVNGGNLSFTTPRLPTILTVTSAGNSGAGTLRQTILNSISGDTISFHPGMGGATITLTSPLVLTSDITIDASGLFGGMNLSGGNTNRIFEVNSNAVAVFKALTLLNGASVTRGGAIMNNGNLTLDRCTLFGNIARGTNGADVSGFNSNAGGTGSPAEGGAIYNSGTLTVNQCTMTGNQTVGGTGGKGGNGFCPFGCFPSGPGGTGGTASGSAIYNVGTLEVNQSTFSGNTATGGNGGPGGTGGSANGAQGPVGPAMAAGIYQAAGSFTLFNSIVAGNTPDNLFGPVNTTGNNLTNGNPVLTALTFAGGPTRTMMPLAHSPAFEAGAASPFSTDQRGQPRLQGTATDIGSVEVPAHSATTLGASNVTGTTATLYGNYDGPIGVSCHMFFECGTTTNYGSFSTTNYTSSSNQDSRTVTGLLPSTTYHFRFVAISTYAAVRGGDMTFTTPAAPPAVTTLSANDVTAMDAMLNGSVNPSGLATGAYFEFGTDTNYGGLSGVSLLAAGNMPSSVSNLVSGLAPGTLYHFRVVATNSAGINRGADVSFTTRALSPVVTTLPATEIHGVGATLNASVHPGNGVATVHFIYTTDPAFTNTLLKSGTISNPSFESNTFTVFPGYATNNGEVINGWTMSSSSRIGLNPSGGNPFNNSGYVPHGANVAFIQSVNSTNTLSTVVSNLVEGRTYRVTFRSNCRGSYNPPGSTWSLNGEAFVPFTSYPATVPAYTNSNTFIATSNTAVMELQNFSSSDTAVIVDDFYIDSLFTGFSATNIVAATNVAVPVAIAVTNLQPLTTYYFYAVAINSSGTAYGEMISFTTAVPPPIVTTLPAIGVTSAGATLNGTVDSKGFPATAYFEYGLTTNYGSFTLTNTVPTNATMVVSNVVGNLAPGTQYHFRLVGVNEANLITGTDQTFTTDSRTPVVIPVSATVLGTNSANGLVSVQLSAIVRPNGATTTGYFEYGRTAAYSGTNSFGSIPAGIVESNVMVTVSFGSGLSYHWRVVAENSVGSAASSDQTFSLGELVTGSGIPGDLNGDGIVSQEELATVYSNYVTNSPWLYMTNVVGLGETNVTFALSNPVFGSYTVQSSTNLIDWEPLGAAEPRYFFMDTNAPALPQRYYRLVYP